MYIFHVLKKIQNNDFIIDESYKVGYLVILLWCNNIQIHDEFISKVENYMSVDCYHYLLKCLKDKNLTFDIDTIEKSAYFLTMMYNLDFGCSKRLKEQLNLKLSDENRFLFNCAIDVYYKVIKNEITRDFVNRMDKSKRFLWFKDMIRKQTSKRKFRTREYFDITKVHDFPNLGYATVCDKFHGDIPVSTPM